MTGEPPRDATGRGKEVVSSSESANPDGQLVARPPIGTQLWATTRALVREEWRLHAKLFGGSRFLTIPVLIAAFAVGTTWLITETGTAPDSVILGLHAGAVAFGLYAGTAGFAGSAMIEDVFGSHHFLLGLSATLPLSRRLFLGLFLLKDAAFYGVFFILPMAVGVSGLSGLSLGTLVLVLELWISLWLVFLAGMTTTVAAISARTNGVPAWAIGLGAAGAVSAYWITGSLRTAIESLVTVGSPISAVGLVLVTVLIGAVSLHMYDPGHAPPSRTAQARFDRVRDRLPTSNPLVVKALLDLGRSSGGFAKPFVAIGLLFGLVDASTGVVESITGVTPSPGIFFGGILGVSAFTTYNWLTQFDDVDAYLVLPVSIVDVFRAKRIAFVFVGIPMVVGPYVIAVIWFDATLLDALAGAAILVGYSGYYYGLTVALAGFSPNEFLFDGARFGAFGIGVALVLVPTLISAFVLTPPSAVATVTLVFLSGLLACVGIALSNWAATYWADRSMRGTA